MTIILKSGKVIGTLNQLKRLVNGQIVGNALYAKRDMVGQVDALFIERVELEGLPGGFVRIRDRDSILD